MEVGIEQFQDPECFCETVYPGNTLSYTHEVSLTWLPKHELNRRTPQGMLMWMGDSSGT